MPSPGADPRVRGQRQEEARCQRLGGPVCNLVGVSSNRADPLPAYGRVSEPGRDPGGGEGRAGVGTTSTSTRVDAETKRDREARERREEDLELKEMNALRLVLSKPATIS